MKRIGFIYTFLYSAILCSLLRANVPITNFSPSDYDAGIQNWSLAIQDNGWLYVANNYGLLEFDGSRWQLYGVWGGTPLRSVAIGADHLIYAGSTNEFGRFRSNNLGQLVYESLSSHTAQTNPFFGEIWSINFLADNVYFQSNNDIFVYSISNDTIFQIIHRQERIFCSQTINNGLYIATTSGIYAVVGNNLNLLRGSDLLQGYEVRSMAALTNSTFLIATDLGGLYIYDGEHIVPYTTSIDAFLHKNQIYTFALRDSLIAIGTVSDGIALVNTSNSEISYINRAVGMQNNTVLSLVFDRHGYLWAGLDQGLSHVFIDYPITNMLENELSIGAGYCATDFDNSHYYGTNQGVYTYSKDSPLLIEGSQGQVWSLDSLNGRLYCCHHRGLYEIKKNRLIPLSEQTGFWNIRRLDGTRAVVGSYSGLYVLYLDDSSNSLRKISGIDETAFNFEIDESGYLWFNGLNGIYRITLENNSVIVDTVLLKSEYGGSAYIVRADNEVFVTTDTKCFSVGRDGRLHDASDYFSGLAGAGLYYQILSDESGNTWFMKPHELYFKPSGASASDIIVSDSHFFIDGFYFLRQADNHTIIFGGVDGFYSINPELLLQVESDVSARVYVREMLSTNNGDSLVYGESYPVMPSDIVLSYAENSLRFRFGGSMMSQCEYSLCLEPLENTFSSWTGLNIKEYTSLHEGRYTLKVKMRIVGTNQEVQSDLSFTILPPWYRHWLAITMYILVALLLLYVVYRSIRQRLIHKYQQESFEQEKRILELEKERAAADLRHKSQEMSNLLLSQVNRQELIQDIRADLFKISDTLAAGDNTNAKKRVQSLLEKLAKQSANEIDWSKFEENFDVVNDRFIEKLTAQFPTLNKNERKLCVYIRMGLYNKEIAPLLNMSTRGVEMLRYRMRRKMNLDREENLEQMLLKI